MGVMNFLLMLPYTRSVEAEALLKRIVTVLEKIWQEPDVSL